jgi:zinc transporter ZupT
MNKFIKQLCILTLVVIVASVFLRAHLTVWWPAIVGFFFIVGIIVFYFADKAKKKDMRRFTNFYMGATVAKMVVYLTIIFIYAITFKEDAKRFAVTFLAYYLVYSIFETYKLAKKDKKSNE